MSLEKILCKMWYVSNSFRPNFFPNIKLMFDGYPFQPETLKVRFTIYFVNIRPLFWNICQEMYDLVNF